VNLLMLKWAQSASGGSPSNEGATTRRTLERVGVSIAIQSHQPVTSHVVAAKR